MNGAALLAISALICLTVAVVFYAGESRIHKINARLFMRENTQLLLEVASLNERVSELTNDLAFYTQVLGDTGEWNNHPSRRHLRSIDGDA